MFAAFHALQASVGSMTCKQLERRLARAELDGEISEFCSLSLRSVVAMLEGSEFAADYLGMAEAVAVSPHERAFVTSTRLLYDLLHRRRV